MFKNITYSVKSKFGGKSNMLSNLIKINFFNSLMPSLYNNSIWLKYGFKLHLQENIVMSFIYIYIFIILYHSIIAIRYKSNIQLKVQMKNTDRWLEFNSFSVPSIVYSIYSQQDTKCDLHISKVL